MLLSLQKSGNLLSPDIQKQAEGCWVDLDEEQEVRKKRTFSYSAFILQGMAVQQSLSQ